MAPKAPEVEKIGHKDRKSFWVRDECNLMTIHKGGLKFGFTRAP